MPDPFGQSDPYDDWDAEDPDSPQTRDLVDEDHEETPTVPCPNCRRPVPDFADRCPYCGDWIIQSAGEPTRRKPWFIAVVIIAIVAFLYWYAL